MVKNSFAAMEAQGEGQMFVPMLADFVAVTCPLLPYHSLVGSPA
jgi:hypothetical protein